MKVEIDYDVLKNLYKDLHWFVSHECDYRIVTPKLLSNMDKVATVLSEYDSSNPVEILRMASNRDYNVGHNFVRFNGYGNLVSSNDVFALGLSSDEIADFLIENEEVADEWDIDVPEICTDPLSEEF